MHRLFPLLLLASLVGCSSDPDPDPAYDPGWTFPLRTDPIVLALPTATPAGKHDDPAKLDEHLAALPALGGKVLLPDQLPEADRTRLKEQLDTLFGTPAAPAVAGLDAATAERFALSPDSLKGIAKKYKTACANCHGMTGDGRGTAGLYADPHPRDFRSGKFKAAGGAGVQSGRPRFADVERIIRHGAEGTTMKGDVPEAEVRPLAGYVVFLSVRGEVEIELMKGLADGDVSDLEVEARSRVKAVLAKWADADAELAFTHKVRPRPDDVTPDYTASLRRGKSLFETAGCVKCHQDGGHTPAFRYDVWGSPNRVRDLTDPARHWAKEPADLARQVKYGIAAANMPGAASLTDDEVSDVVNYVRELPYPARLK
jgi:mono/diheme cytochrome c family protein